MSTANSNRGAKKKGGATVAIIVAGIAVIIGLMGVIIYLLSSRRPESSYMPQPAAKGVIVNQDNVDEFINRMALQTATPIEEVPAGYYTVSMTYDWHFPTGSSASTDALVRNQPYNTNDVFFELALAEDEEKVLYTSPVIPLGSRLEQIVLDTPLEAGTYDCVMTYYLLDDNQVPISTLRVTVRLFVEA